jgi:hypothetical protein
VTQLLSVTGGKLHQRGILTLLRTLTPKRTSAEFIPLHAPTTLMRNKFRAPARQF